MTTTPPESMDSKSFEDGRHVHVSTEPAVVMDQTKLKKSWLGFFWDTADYGPEERALLFKVDAAILTFASLGYFIKNLDQTNATSAFVSGMKEDLGMYGNQLVTSTTLWTVGYVIGQLPVAFALTRISPRWVIPSLELAWGIATFATYSIKSYKALYGLRFLVGLLESGFYPGMIYVCASWYTPTEVTKRATLFWTAGFMGQMFSGYLQSAAYNNLSGHGGLAGWRWLYIVDAIITIPIAILGFVFLPSLPWDAKPNWFLSARDIEIAQNRIQRVGRKGSASWTKEKVKRLLTSWPTYMIPICYALWNNAYAQNPFTYWLKALSKVPGPLPGVHYTVSQINSYPTITNGVLIFSSLAYSLIVDGPLKGKKWPGIFAGALISLPILIALRVLPIYQNVAGHIALYSLLNVGSFAGPGILSWGSSICENDSEQRAIVITLSNDLAYVVQAVAPNFVWKTTDFPAAHKGLVWCIVLNVLLAIWTGAILFMLKRDRRLGYNQLDEDFKQAAKQLSVVEEKP